MVTVERQVNAPPEHVWQVLADGWTYTWVVGTALIRQVDPDWPHPPSRIHHSVGAWPFLLSDETVSILCEPERRLELQPKGRPFLGEARVVIELVPSGTGTRVRLSEEAVAGPGRRIVPDVLRRLVIRVRNREGVRRLALRAEGLNRAAANGSPPRP
jgi:uncharacterized protein YndB with AHSA1/START domain